MTARRGGEPYPSSGYMRMACVACLHELIAEDWEEALLEMWDHHATAHALMAILDFSVAFNGDLFMHHSTFEELTAEQRARLAWWDAAIARLNGPPTGGLHWSHAAQEGEAA